MTPRDRLFGLATESLRTAHALTRDDGTFSLELSQHGKQTTMAFRINTPNNQQPDNHDNPDNPTTAAGRGFDPDRDSIG